MLPQSIERIEQKGGKLVRAKLDKDCAQKPKPRLKHFYRQVDNEINRHTDLYY